MLPSRHQCPPWVSSTGLLHFLFLLNLGLQMWDGFATYHGLQLGIAEGNPFVRAWMEILGVGWALVGVKTTACGLLLFLRRLSNLLLSTWAMMFTAGIYVVFSFLPWLKLLFLG